MKKKLTIAILGSGNIGTDLLIKVLRSPYLTCAAFIGRNAYSAGMLKAQSLGVPVSSEGISHLQKNPHLADLVFDATSSLAHREHALILKKLNKFVIDLTPAKIGTLCVPVVNLSTALLNNNVNMVTCGGQASVPIAHALALTHHSIDYLEVVSSIASQSAGPATRMNLDEYIHTTEYALKLFSNAKKTKAILNLNPADPCIDMQTTLYAKVKNPNLERFTVVLNHIVTQVQQYVPGYKILVNPLLENDRIVVMIKVTGLGDYLPEYAGNLDIINCAALAIAEKYATMMDSNAIKDICHEVNIN
jgi:acetaldehyde dehydrogenase